MNPPPRARFHWRTIAALLALALLTLAVRFLLGPSAPSRPPAPAPADALALLNRFEDEQAAKYWGPELRAQKFGAQIDQLWNRLNAATNKFAILQSLDFELILPQFANAIAETYPHGIRVISPSGSSWQSLLAEQAAAGWQLQQCEFRHLAFFTNQLGRGLASTYYLSGHLVNPRTAGRAIVEGKVMLWWNERPDLPPVRQVDARQLQVRLRRGPPAFARVLNDTVEPSPGSYFIDPLLAWDLDRDGRTELILAAKNALYRRSAQGQWQAGPLLAQPPGLILAALLGDFTGDGAVDFLSAGFDGLLLHPGTPDGRFTEPPRLAWQAQPRLKFPQVLTAGDVDADGDLDLFLGQYKVPYDQGQMPFPYFDANDGYPSFLLLNDGTGQFSDGTAAAGLAPKRSRRVYSASLADLDRDSDLDLVVVSDFAGLDAYANNGRGSFTEITQTRFPETSGFGMAHTFADFNRDGALDILMIGMNSPTADRLASLRLDRPYDVPDAGMRARSTYGNRLFFGRSDGTFRQTPAGAGVARTGWSWGAAAQDFDNDGFPDLYIANGHESRQSVAEYEPEFWLHDIYVGRSRENALAQAYFQQKYARTRGRGQSYGGYEKNRFLLNLGGTNFIEAAHLFGLALEQDSRNVLAEDLDGDGRLDLVVTTFEAWPARRQTLQIFENQLPETGHWLAVAFPPEAPYFGARVETSGGAQVLPAGDSYRSQQPLRLHLGLGPDAAAPRIRVYPVGAAPRDLPGLAPDSRQAVR